MLENEAYTAAQFEEELPPIIEPGAEEAPGAAASASSFWDKEISFSWLLAKTGQGSIDEYVDHPLNPHESRSIAQILRGLTGIAGSLDYALIDIGLGAIEFTKEKRSSIKRGKINEVTIVPE